QFGAVQVGVRGSQIEALHATRGSILLAPVAIHDHAVTGYCLHGGRWRVGRHGRVGRYRGAGPAGDESNTEVTQAQLHDLHSCAYPSWVRPSLHERWLEPLCARRSAEEPA